ncbi:probable ATP-dependent RNA helicase kurz [Harmonia axyridis]|uniref:probable ATP-dependent RNA helicase kurz n=1 Tax=Harmonia axyridis TaxID=115357 RepID=UPI001E275CA4|nr:probable ATP-dependent RNA helicase kurz [Harmonia axyridis]
MPKKRFNWKSREVNQIIIDDSETSKLNIDLKAEGHYDDANKLCLPSQKRKTKIKKQKGPTVILSKKRRKQLEKIVEKKKKKENRKQILEELQKYRIPEEEQKKLVSLSSIQTKGIKRIFLEERKANAPPKKRKFNIDEENLSDNTENTISLDTPAEETTIPIKKYDPNNVKLSDFELNDIEIESSDDEIEIKVDESEIKQPIMEEKIVESQINQPVIEIKDDNTENSKCEKRNEITVKKESKPAVFVDVIRDSKIQKQRMKLPILAEEQHIMEVINANSIVIISGETGSGKTTQLPQFLYEAGYALERQIGVTEPRRIAAISMSERVAKEMSLSSREVSFLIRFQGNVTEDTKIKFMTDGVLLKEIQSDFLLNKYSVIILDEAHERSLYTDLLVGLLAWIIKLREKRNIPLKLIVMSATLRIQDFTANQRLFKTLPPVVNVESRQFPVTIHFNRRTDDDYLKEAFRKTVKIHSTLPEGGILIFVTGQQEVYHLVKKLKKKFPYSQSNKKAVKAKVEEEEDDDCEGKKKGKINRKNKIILPRINLDDYSLPRDAEVVSDDEDVDDAIDVESEDETTTDDAVCHGQPLWVLPLFSNLPIHKQNKIFQPAPSGCRVCVISTNVAETSLTIPGIKYVVDTGKTKAKLYDKVTGVSTFRICWTSKASADQRAGRAGRTGPGHCYRLYSSAVFNDTFVDFEEPEIKKVPLDDLVLRMRSMQITNILNFPFPTAPDLLQLKTAEARLKILGILDEDGKITKLGKIVSKYPLSPRFGKMVALSFQQDIVAYTLILVAALSVPQLLLEGSKEGEAQRWTATRIKWAGSGNSYLLGDNMVLMTSVGTAEVANAQGKLDLFCLDHGIRHKALTEVRKLRIQMTNEINTNIPEADLVVDPKLPPPTDHQAKMLRQILLLGLGDQVARKVTLDEVPTGESKSKYKYAYKVGSMEDLVFLHRTCILKRTLPDWVIYQELYETNKVYMRGVTAIEVEWLPLYYPNLCQLKIPDSASYDEGKVMCCVDGTFGSQAWPLRRVRIEFPETEEAYRWFAKFLLEGEVVEKLKKYTSHLLSSPAIMIKKYAKLQPRTNSLTNALIERKVRRKDTLLEVWKDNSSYLLSEFLQWVPQSLHADITIMWPPVEKCST